jgi:isochorismate synthase
MSCFALYRLPYADHYTLVEQAGTTPLRLRSCTELNGTEGFVVAPFQVTDEQPIWVIQGNTSMHKAEPRCEAQGARHANAPEEYYAIDFANFHAQLQAGTLRKIVLARCAEEQRTRPVDPKELFLLACSLYPRMFIALASLPDGTCWLTATPEILLEGIGSEWRTIALAGTMQLQGDELDGEGEATRWSTKNIQEQRYVATYIAECLERFSLDFREEGPRTVRAANLVHLRSDFTFSLQSHEPVGNLLQELHPTPAVCGLPKREAFSFIVKHEHTPRQYYSGFMGPLGLDAETHLYVSLRCMQITETKYRLYAGGGLLKESRLEQEWQETEAKMLTMRRLLSSLTP